MATKTYTKYVLTGGGTGALDAIDGDELADNYRAMVITDDNTHHYILDASSGLAENSPDVIVPDSNAGTKRWILKYPEIDEEEEIYYLTGANYPDYTASDQGDDTADGDNNTINYYVDQIGSDEGTIILRHNSGGATTTYDLDTDETIPDNITLKIERGAIIDGVTEDEILTINGSIDAGLCQIFGSSLTVKGSPKVEFIYPHWFGAKGDDDNDDTAAIQKSFDTGYYTSVPVKVPSGTYQITLTDTNDMENNALWIYDNSDVHFSTSAWLKLESVNGKVIWRTDDPSTKGSPPTGHAPIFLYNVNIDMQQNGDAGLLIECIERGVIIKPRIINPPSGQFDYDDGNTGDGEASYDKAGIILKGIHGVYGCYYTKLDTPSIEATAGNEGQCGIYIGTSKDESDQRANDTMIIHPNIVHCNIGIDIPSANSVIIFGYEVSLSSDTGIRVGPDGDPLTRIVRGVQIFGGYAESCGKGIHFTEYTINCLLSGPVLSSGTITPTLDEGANNIILGDERDSAMKASRFIGDTFFTKDGVFISDDDVYKLPFLIYYGMLNIIEDGGRAAVISFGDIGTMKISGHSDYEVTDGVLNGTTGSDDKITVSFDNDEKELYIENRSGVKRVFTFTNISVRT